MPTEGKLYAPADGKIVMIADSLHAIGMQTKEGTEILMHIGMDTVELEGKFFTPHVKTGDEVKQGTLLMEFDMDGIKAAGYALTTPVVITEYDDSYELVIKETGEVKEGTTIIQLV